MTSSRGESFQRRRGGGPWPYWWGPSNLHGCRGTMRRAASLRRSSLSKGHDNVAADARHTIDALGLRAVVEARWGAQRMVLASAEGPGLAEVDVIRAIVQDCGWELLTNCTRNLRPVRWPRLLKSLPMTSSGRPILGLASIGDEARRCCFILPLHARWQVRCFATGRRAVMCGRTCGCSAVEAVASHHGWCSHFSAAGAGRRRRFGCISVPPPRSVGRAGSAPVGGDPKPGGHCVTMGRCRQVPGRRFRVTCGASGWTGCGAPMHRQRPYPYCCVAGASGR